MRSALLTILLCIGCLLPARGNTVNVVLDGKVVTPRVVFTDTDGTAIIEIAGMWLRIPSGQPLRLTWSDDHARLYQVGAGSGRPVACAVERHFEPSGDGSTGARALTNGLAGLTDEQIRELWGVRIALPPSSVGTDQASTTALSQLHILDPRTPITVRWGLDMRAVPVLPPSVRYVLLEQTGSDGHDDFSGMGALHELRAVEIRLLRGAFDAGWLGRASGLQRLLLRGCTLTHSEAIGDLHDLRSLSMSGCLGVERVAFARTLPQLRELDVSRTAVRDLSPLAACERLERITADVTPVDALPDAGCGALRLLQVMTTKLSDETVARFSRAHPSCKVVRGLDTALHEALSGVTRVRVRSGGTCHRHIEHERVLVDVRDAVDARAIADAIVVTEGRAGEDMCCGEPTIEFYRGSDLVVSIGWHHALRLRWSGWPQDPALTPAARERLLSWFDRHGVDGPRSEWTTQVRREQAIRRKRDAFWALLPATVRDSTFTQLPSALEKAVPDPSARASLLLEMFGIEHERWSGFDGFDEFVREMLQTISQDALRGAVEHALTAHRPALVRGAARAWGAGLLAGWQPPSLAALVGALKTSPIATGRREALDELARVRTLTELRTWYEKWSDR